MVYLSEWVKLAAAIPVLMAGGLSEADAKNAICELIASPKTRLSVWVFDLNVAGQPTERSSVRGRDYFDVPVRVLSSEMDWENSRPRGTWRLRAAASFAALGLDPVDFGQGSAIAFIELRRADVESIILAARATVVALPPLEGTSGSGADVISAQTRAADAPSHVAPKGRRGKPPKKHERITAKILNELRCRRFTVEAIEDLPQKELVALFGDGAVRSTVVEAREAAVSEFVANTSIKK
jgi:hypothetical protein